jgi:DNA-binding CsgD family transcriptional regulator
MSESQITSERNVYTTHELVAFFTQLQQGLPSTYFPNRIIPIDLNVDMLNLFSTNDQSVKVIFYYPTFKVLAATKNITSILNISMDSVQNFDDYMALLHPTHIEFIAHYIAWLHELMAETTKQNEPITGVTVCGLKMMDKEGNINRLLARTIPYRLKGQTYPEIGIMTLYNVKYLMKSDVVWSRIKYGKNSKAIGSLSSIDLENKKHDILSEREVELLKYLASGMSINDIAEILHKSPNAIIKHKQNMCARLGVSNTFGLLSICKLCGILE